MAAELHIDCSNGWTVMVQPPVVSQHQRCFSIFEMLFDFVVIAHGRVGPVFKKKQNVEALKYALSLLRVKNWNPESSWDWIVKSEEAIAWLFSPHPAEEIETFITAGELHANTTRIFNLLNFRPGLPSRNAENFWSCGDTQLDLMAGLTSSTNNYRDVIALCDSMGYYELYQYLWKINDIRSPDENLKAEAYFEREGLMHYVKNAEQYLIEKALEDNQRVRDFYKGNSNGENSF